MAVYDVMDGKAIVDDIPVTLPNVEFEKLVDHGANAVVFLGEDTILRRKLAVKIWMPKKNDKRNKYKQAVAEARKLVTLEHPNVTRVFYAGELEAFPLYVCMEYIEGMTLGEYLAKANPGIEQRVRVLDDILSTVEYCQKAGIYHGDLHDRNIIITRGSKPKIIDFGTSIFNSDKSKNLKRASCFLQRITIKLAPDLYRLGFGEIDCFKFHPDYMLDGCNVWLGVNKRLLDLANEDGKSWNSDYEIKSLIFSIATTFGQWPFIDLCELKELFNNTAPDDVYREYFISAMAAEVRGYEKTVRKADLDYTKSLLEEWDQVCIEWKLLKDQLSNKVSSAKPLW